MELSMPLSKKKNLCSGRFTISTEGGSCESIPGTPGSRASGKYPPKRRFAD
jgi:hypothetical protein